MQTIFEKVVNELPQIKREKLEYLCKNPENADHDSLYSRVPEINLIEVNNNYPTISDLSDTVTVAFWNCERGRFVLDTQLIHEIIAQLRHPDILILNEVDYGMARTDNIHATKVLAEVLGMNYVFGVEYLELSKGELHEREVSGENAQSLHGNAILSKFPVSNPALIRLKGIGQWFHHDQKRIGSRIALIANVEIGEYALQIATTHLENEASPGFRQEQIGQVISFLNTRKHIAQHVLAGDLNTSTIDFHAKSQHQNLLRQKDFGTRFLNPIPYEPLFATLRREGYEIERANDMTQPTAFLKELGGEGTRLDWIFTKNLKISQKNYSPSVVPFVGKIEYRNRPIADHNALLLELRLTRQC